MNYANLISAMSAVIKANGNNEITGDLLQQVLRAIINSLGQGYQFMGVATTATNPGTQDARLFYVAEGPGTYSNFGPLTVPDDGQVYLLVLGSSWAAVQLPIPTFAGFSDLVTEVAGKMALVPTATEGHVAEFGNAGQVRDGGVQTSALARRDAGAVAGNLAEFDGNGDPKDSGIAAEDVMKIPAGLMPFGPAGLAEALLDTDSAGAEQEFSLRKSGGDGGAYFRRLLGNTKAFNQLWGKPNTQTRQQVTLSYDNAEKCYVLNGTALAGDTFYMTGDFIVATLPEGHKGLIAVEVLGGSYTPGTANNGYVRGVYLTNSPIKSLNSVGRLEAIQNATGGNSYPAITFYAGDVFDNLKVRVSCIDLTAMQDNSTTPEEFREKYPLLYYAYGRKLIHNKVAKVITKGANQWDEVAEDGGISAVSGQDSSTAGYRRSKNYIPVIGGATYYIKAPVSMAILFYGQGQEYLGATSVVYGMNRTFTAPSNAGYIRFRNNDANSWPTYNHDVCVNISDAEINGQYFPYWERELALDITNQEDTDGNKPFAEGMMGAGSAADYANEVGGAKVMGVLDLGSIDWTYDADRARFLSVNTIASLGIAQGMNAVCANYVVSAQVIATSPDKEISVNGLYIGVKDTAYSDAAVFKSAMDGVKLVYQLATPVPFTWKEPLNTGIKVSKYGTEEITPAQTENIDNAPFRAVTTYSISVANLVAALAALGNRGGAKGLLGGGNQEENPENEELIPEEESPKEEEPKEEETPVVEPEVQSKK